MTVALAVFFGLACAATAAWCQAMSGMGGMAMPGGWTMSMAWMRMPGQTWAQAAAAFLGMWTVMTAAMMLPSFAPTLTRVREIAPTRGPRLASAVGFGYLSAWVGVGAACYAVGLAAAASTMHAPWLARRVPLAGAVAVLLGGAFQCTSWKATRLADCRSSAGEHAIVSIGSAWRHGWRLGRACVASCLGYTSVLLVLGVMDLSVMTVVTCAITAERRMPGGDRTARAIGVLGIVAGAWLAIRATRLG